jgi:hypothetical protein
MKYQFTESYQTLINGLEKLKNECASITEKNENIKYRDLEAQLKDWRIKVIDWINQNVEPAPDFLTSIFSSYCISEIERFFIRFERWADDPDHYMKQMVTRRITATEAVKDYLHLMNKVTSSTIEVGSMQSKQDYIMDLLYEVFNDNFYSIRAMLDLNFIEYRKDEPEELGAILSKKGYVLTKGYGKDNYVKLTVKGASYVERKRKATDKKKAKKKEEEINKKIDVVLEKLESLGYSQEIIFEEIEELKSSSHKLNKKNWVQLLKGKVIDLAVSQVINKETASYILDILSEGASKLLIEK